MGYSDHQSDADRAAGDGFSAQEIDQIDLLLGQKYRGVDEHTDLHVGGLEH